MRKILLTFCLSLLAAAPAFAGDDKQYSVHAPPVTLKAGAQGAAVLTIKPGPGLHFNDEYPAKFKVEAGSTVAKVRKDALSKTDGDVKTAGIDGVVTVPLQALAAGSGPVTIIGSFGLCNAQACFMLRNEKLTVQVTVK